MPTIYANTARPNSLKLTKDFRLKRFNLSKPKATRAKITKTAAENLDWRTWLDRKFSSVTACPMAPRHIRLWEWFAALEPGVKPLPCVEVWPRGGAKSTTGELGVTWLCGRLTRRYVLYVSGTQEQADKHVQSVAGFMEADGVERALNIYGTSKGWKRQELRTANGFNVSGYGLDTGLRGVKIDNWRPDLIIFDDIDSEEDSRKTVEKKMRAITRAILPAGSSDCAVVFLQNKIHRDGIVSQLCDNRADFLHNRLPANVEVAVENLQYVAVAKPDGGKAYKILDGTPSWEGQSLETCEGQINEWGLGSFLREAQQEVENSGGYFFDVGALNYCDADEVPGDLRLCRAWDLAGTEGGGDHTAGPLVGIRPNGNVYVAHLEYEQFGSDKVRKLVKTTAEDDRATYGRIKLRLPQDPGQAGKDQAGQLKDDLKEFSPIVKPVTGSKSVRARGFAEEVNKGNVWFVRAPWNVHARAELRDFKEDETQQVDDFIDAASDAYNELAKPETKPETGSRQYDQRDTEKPLHPALARLRGQRSDND